MGLYARVLPASAGMIPIDSARPCLGVCAPRIRGDDPKHQQATTQTMGCSPHPRG